MIFDEPNPIENEHFDEVVKMIKEGGYFKGDYSQSKPHMFRSGIYPRDLQSLKFYCENLSPGGLEFFLNHWLEQDNHGYLFKDVLQDGSIIAILPLLYGHAQLGRGTDTIFYFNQVWDYESHFAAFNALREWELAGFEGEPTGWHRHPESGRYRSGGDPALEYTKQRD